MIDDSNLGLAELPGWYDLVTAGAVDPPSPATVAAAQAAVHAAALADEASALEGVTHVRVAVRKPNVLLGGPLAYAEIVVERSRR